MHNSVPQWAPRWLQREADAPKPVVTPYLLRETRPQPSSAPAKGITVVVTVHAPYLRFLPEVIASIEAQAEPGPRLLMCDNCEPPDLPPNWTAVAGSWNDPNKARNAAFERVATDWVVFWDADNVMPANYLATAAQAAESADASVAVCYPSVVRVSSGNEAGFEASAEPWDYWRAKERSMADTCSVWRAKALAQLSEVFPVGLSPLDDYCLVQRLTQLKWQGMPVPITVGLRDHEQRRSLVEKGKTVSTLWRARRHAIVTLWSARWHCTEELAEWFRKADLPQHTDLIWVDNAAQGKFTTWLWRLAAQVRKRREVASLQIVRVGGRPRDNGWEAIHTHVGALYNRVLHGLTQDIIVTLEDDVIPPLDGLPELCAPFLPFTKIAAVAGVYPTREQPDLVAASTTPDRWGRMPKLSELSGALEPIGMVAGGFTAWAGWALQKVLPFHITDHPKLGWDGTASRALTQAGFKLLLNGAVRCQHRTEFVAQRALPLAE